MHFNLTDFLQPLDKRFLSGDESYKDGEIGNHIAVYTDELPDVGNADIVLVGCTEERGNGPAKDTGHSADAVRKAFYRMYYWHGDVTLADLGNVRTGKELKDTYAALKTVIKELISLNKTVIVLGG